MYEIKQHIFSNRGCQFCNKLIISILPPPFVKFTLLFVSTKGRCCVKPLIRQLYEFC